MPVPPTCRDGPHRMDQRPHSSATAAGQGHWVPTPICGDVHRPSAANHASLAAGRAVRCGAFASVACLCCPVWTKDWRNHVQAEWYVQAVWMSESGHGSPVRGPVPTAVPAWARCLGVRGGVASRPGRASAPVAALRLPIAYGGDRRAAVAVGRGCRFGSQRGDGGAVAGSVVGDAVHAELLDAAYVHPAHPGLPQAVPGWGAAHQAHCWRYPGYVHCPDQDRRSPASPALAGDLAPYPWPAACSTQ